MATIQVQTLTAPKKVPLSSLESPLVLGPAASGPFSIASFAFWRILYQRNRAPCRLVHVAVCQRSVLSIAEWPARQGRTTICPPVPQLMAARAVPGVWGDQ